MRIAPEQPKKDIFNFAESKQERSRGYTHTHIKHILSKPNAKAPRHGCHSSWPDVASMSDREIWQKRTSYTEYEVDA
jgi:hypothetical protein